LSAFFERHARRLAWLFAALATSCSLTRPSIDHCSTNADCRRSFGYDMVCGGDGLCARAATPARCTLTEPKDLLTAPSRYKSSLIFGSLMDRSLTTQRAREQAIQLATDEVNAQGGLDNRPFGIVFCDVEQNPALDPPGTPEGGLSHTDAALASAKYLANDLGVAAIIGPSASTDALAVFNEVKDYGTLVISPAATSSSLTGAGVGTGKASDQDPGLFWRTAPSDSLQGKAIAEYLAPPRANSVAVVAESGAYGQDLAAVFESAWSGTLAYNGTFTSSAQRDQDITQAGASNADFVVFISSQTSDTVAFAQQAAAAAGYQDKNLFLTDSAANSDFVQETAAYSGVYSRLYGSRFQVPSDQDSSVYDQFDASFQAAFQVDPNQYSYVAQSYDAAWLTFYGSAWSVYQEGGLSGLGIARGLRHVSSGDNVDILPSNWTKVTASFQAGQSINVVGASGNLDFDPTTEEISADVEIWKVSGSSFNVVDTIAP
jgi:ABC-type branched-subunit amino acid transport system substrate-binding protein